MPQLFSQIGKNCFLRSAKIITSPYDYTRFIVWLRTDKICRSNVLKSPIPYGPLLTKSSNWRIAKTFITLYRPHDCLICHIVWLRMDKNCRRGSILKCFAPIWSRVNENENKLLKFWKVKILKKKKKKVGSFPYNFGQDPIMWFLRNLNYRGRHLRHDSSSASYQLGS